MFDFRQFGFGFFGRVEGDRVFRRRFAAGSFFQRRFFFRRGGGRRFRRFGFVGGFGFFFFDFFGRFRDRRRLGNSRMIEVSPALWASWLVAEPITTPKASIPITATAAARGEGMKPRLAAAAAAAGTATDGGLGRATGGGRLSRRARRSSIGAIRPATAGGSEPRRVPHSTQ